MKPFTISQKLSDTYFKWLLWGSAALSILYFGLAIEAYLSGEETWEWVINILIGIIWLIAGGIQVFGETYHIPEITFNDAGITWRLKKSEKQIQWYDIRTINLNNNAITIHTETEEKEELNIAHLEYKELQTVKERLKKFAATHNVNYFSKY